MAGNDVFNALVRAVKDGRLNDAALFVTLCGADVNAVDNGGWSALHHAARRGSLDIVEMLATYGADVHALTRNGVNALMLAATRGHLDVVTYLAGQGVNLLVQNSFGASALMWATQNGHLGVATLFVTLCRASVNAVDNGGWSALHNAALGGFLDVVEMLATHGADVHALTNGGENALMLAAYDDHPDICTYLSSLGLDPALKDRRGHSALSHYAQWLDDDPYASRPAPTKEEKQARVKLLTDARAEYLELQRREERYQRRKNAITFLQGSGFLLTAAQREARKAEEAQVDTYAKLANIDRSTKEANLKYLMDRVFREDKGMHLGREIVMML